MIKFKKNKKRDTPRRVSITTSGDKSSLNNKVLSLKYYLLIIAFLEGGAVMACELIGAKLIAPYFGSSLYVWASVLAVTLGGLAAGYYLGGYFSKKYENTNLLFYVLLLAGFFMFLMPFTSKFILERTIDFEIRTGSIISLLLYLFPCLLFFGMTSPVIINLLTETRETSGKSAGTVYSISTIGGIFATLLIGFYIMPEFGISRPAMLIGGFIILIALIYFLYKKKYWTLLILFIIIVILNKNKAKPEQSGRFKFLYQCEGILGQLKVIDHPFYSNYKGWQLGRAMVVNNVGQTVMDYNHPDYSLSDYAFFVSNAASVYPPASDVLLLGLGGGTLYKQFTRQGYNVDAVELDERIKDVAVKYFGINPDINVFVDDARHFIKTSEKKYDIILFDIFTSETPPAHVLTVECFQEVKKIMKPGGMVMINFSGFINGKTGRASRSVYKTLVESGFKTKMLVTHLTDEAHRNLIFLASESHLDFTNTNYTEPGMPQIDNLEKHFLNPDDIDFSSAIILKDDGAAFEKMYIDAALQWKKSWNKFYTKNFIDKKIPVFK